VRDVVTVNATPFVFAPLANTTTLPAVAPEGTDTTILVELQLEAVAVVPLNFTVLLPCVEPKLVPVIVTEEPTAPEVVDKLEMLGVARTVKLTPLLVHALELTKTLPVVVPDGTMTVMLVALQLVGVAAVPLKVTVLVP